METIFQGISIRMSLKRIYYVPGIISLIGLPILIFILLPKDHEPVQPASKRIKFFIPTDPSDEPYIARFSEQNFNPTILMDRKRSLICRKLEDLQFLHDTTAVLKVDFGDTNTFSDFMWVLKQAKAYQLKIYAYFDNSFYLLGTPPPDDLQAAPPTM